MPTSGTLLGAISSPRPTGTVTAHSESDDGLRDNFCYLSLLYSLTRAINDLNDCTPDSTTVTHDDGVQPIRTTSALLTNNQSVLQATTTILVQDTERPPLGVSRRNKPRSLGAKAGELWSLHPLLASAGLSHSSSTQLPKETRLQSSGAMEGRVGGDVQGVASLEGGSGVPAKKRKRGAGERSRRSRARGGREKRERVEGCRDGQLQRLEARRGRRTEVHWAGGFSMASDTNPSTSGWQGRAPPKKTQQELQALYDSGEIAGILGTFYPIPYLETAGQEMAAAFADRRRRVFMYRSFRAPWLPGLQGGLAMEVQALLGESLVDSRLQRSHEAGLRGPHFPCIIGHYRPYCTTVFPVELPLWVPQTVVQMMVQRVRIRADQDVNKLLKSGGSFKGSHSRHPSLQSTSGASVASSQVSVPDTNFSGLRHMRFLDRRWARGRKRN